MEFSSIISYGKTKSIRVKRGAAPRTREGDFVLSKSIVSVCIAVLFF